jgi:hypothetical protein
VEKSLSVLADDIGPHEIMWATDYPHSDGFFARGATDDWATAPTLSP